VFFYFPLCTRYQGPGTVPCTTGTIDHRRTASGLLWYRDSEHSNGKPEHVLEYQVLCRKRLCYDSTSTRYQVLLNSAPWTLPLSECQNTVVCPAVRAYLVLPTCPHGKKILRSTGSLTCCRQMSLQRDRSARMGIVLH
jgi:hypothetical protein